VSRLGLIVNPIAGMGGRVALKGTDGLDTIARARALGAKPLAAVRAERSLARLELREATLTLVAAPGVMGADIAIRHRFETELLPIRGPGGDTTADDTRAAAGELLARGVDLILFAGGDGTTRDIHDIVGDRVPVLGIPTGVKMHSGVFATTPESAGDVAAHFFAGGAHSRLRDGEVVDVDEDGLRAGRLSTQLYGVMRVPDDRLRVPPVKAGGFAGSDEADLNAVCARIADGMDPRRLYVLGPGTTTRRIMRRLGLSATLLGIDVVRAGCLLAQDVGEAELLRLLGREPATLLVGVVGGQGAVFGRGNQQLSPAVIRRIGVDNVEIVAGLRKLLSLDPTLLHVDTGDPTLDTELAGYRRVHVAPGRTLVAKVDA
jgi:predicted polyphosphate/ATP-dependent NAD kinase